MLILMDGWLGQPGLNSQGDNSTDVCAVLPHYNLIKSPLPVRQLSRERRLDQHLIIIHKQQQPQSVSGWMGIWYLRRSCCSLFSDENVLTTLQLRGFPPSIRHVMWYYSLNGILLPGQGMAWPGLSWMGLVGLEITCGTAEIIYSVFWSPKTAWSIFARR